jgi:tRNA(fMet)-specific endonuclease VapC
MKLTYLLDTSLVSELAKPRPSPRILERVRSSEGRMGLPAPVWHELLFGLARLAEGRRKDSLRAFLLEVLAPGMPILPYDEHASWIHADLRAELEARGQSPSFVDSQIAAIAIGNNLVLVTRNLRDFGNFRGLMKENWFEEEG